MAKDRDTPIEQSLQLKYPDRTLILLMHLILYNNKAVKI